MTFLSAEPVEGWFLAPASRRVDRLEFNPHSIRGRNDKGDIIMQDSIVECRPCDINHRWETYPPPMIEIISLSSFKSFSKEAIK
jgi:hypothetical protein